jgi:hypothetical protein
MDRTKVTNELIAELLSDEWSGSDNSEKLITFINTNYKLGDGEYFEKLHEELPTLKMVNDLALLKYQRRAAKYTKVIMIIMLIYLAASIVIALNYFI